MKARTYEGSGIGLALVKELVSLHGGSIRVKSKEGAGTEFIVSIPRGKSHLPAKQIYESVGALPAGILSASYRDEAVGWLSEDKRRLFARGTVSLSGKRKTKKDKPVIVLADDNADMREYLSNILSDDYNVIPVENGRKVIDLVERGVHADLVLADVMMPEMDGHTMVSILKKNEHYARIPVLLLSARSGEDAKVEGMQSGADDYLVKPFSSRELKALVEARIQISRVRNYAEWELNRKNAELEQRVLERTAQLEESRSMIEKQNAHLSKILDAIPHMTWVLDASGKIKFLNDRWYASTGLTEEQCPDLDPLQCNIFHPSQKKEIGARWAECINSPQRHVGEVLIKDREGNYRWNLDILEPITEETGAVEMWIETFTDVHEQFLSEKQVQEAKDLLEAILNSSTNAISVFDTVYDEAGNIDDFQWKYFNIMTRHFVGKNDLYGQSLKSELTNHRTAALLMDKFKEVMQYGKTLEFEYEEINQGLKYWYQAIAVKLEDRLVVTQHDITDKVKSRQNLVRLNKSLKQKNYELKAMNEELTNFAFIASHDLREPLRKIQLFTHDLIERESNAVTARGKDNGRKILSSVTRMNALIDDILTFSRVSSAPRSVAEEVNLNDQLQIVLGDLSEMIAEHNAKVAYDNLPVLHGNPSQLSQLLQNLVANGIKFQPPGNIPHISVEGRFISGRDIDSPLSNPDTQYFNLEVSDNGIGFEEQYAEKIFHMFQRLHGRSEFPGTGMGLAICKKIMLNHKGFIIAKGKPGEGSTFSCYFPLN